ncbi:complement factor H-like [Parambassis ranga]|uniref:Complement factor H-like n=1 Tax=Parambassis ranga TaxID=210632 RepID=A0A6P7K283_9TELE|nr:complement factor H-like [Parambassis ranga]
MFIRYLGFALLVGFPGVLHAQSPEQSCTAPTLEGGFYAPKQQTYSHGTKLSYACHDGRRPPVSGWWGTSTCLNGKWSRQPECVETINACFEPPKIPHAVIIDQEYQELFATGSRLRYECEDGNRADTQQFIECAAGMWSVGSSCTADCRFDTTKYPKLIPDGVKVVRQGEDLKQECVTKQWTPDEISVVSCINGTLSLTKCCYRPTIKAGACTEPMDTQEDGVFDLALAV